MTIQQRIKDKLTFLLLLTASLVLWILGLLLLSGSSDAEKALAATFVGFGSVAHAYAWWYVLDQKEGGRSPLDFSQELIKAVIVLLALLGAALVLQGLGALTGFEVLNSVGSTLGDLFGGS